MSEANETASVHCSVVVPVYNSESSLTELCEGIAAVFTERQQTYEIVLVDDCSRDSSWQVMQRLREANPAIKIIRLMRNYGQHNATLCGFWHVSGERVITMDDDLQHSPRDIPLLLDKLDEGHDAVIAALSTKQDTAFKRFASGIMRRLTTAILDKPKGLKLSSFRAMTSKLVESIREIRTPQPYIVAMLFSLTTDVVNVNVTHAPRRYGRSNYSFSKLLQLSFSLLINYSSLPIRFLSFVGGIVALAAFSIGIFFFVKKLIYEDVPTGWTSIVVLLSFFNGLLLVILSLMGEYFRRIINEVSYRKQFVVRDKHL